MRSMQSWQELSPEQIEPQQQARLRAIVHQALGHGINHLETARAYGSSEHQLGRVLQEWERSDYILQTKVAPEPDAAVFRRNVLDSLARLQVERLDLLAIHGINTFRQLWQVCRAGGCLEEARRLQTEGRVGWIGFSSHGPREVILEAVRLQEHGGFDYCNLHWYTIFQRHEAVLQEAGERDLGVFVISPSDKGGMLHTPPALLTRLCRPLSPMQFNDLFCLQHPGIHTISIGAARPADFAEHLKVLPHLADRELVATIYNRWQAQMQRLTGRSHPDAHWDRFPFFEEIPGYINIPRVLWLYDLARGWDLLAYARSRYQQLGSASQWLPGNVPGWVAGYDLKEVAVQAGLDEQELKRQLTQAHELLARGAV
ncbi:aldo/keto reductase [Desulfogranum mediterraneum]|uniref:aldo/keto reductase n=1 Tax=Desulfogranum mediterraneum TaxID=160661 RepID=UPI0006889401|nr:aldo/keto reductase [Desulfogranum mediterraneum]